MCNSGFQNQKYCLDFRKWVRKQFGEEQDPTGLKGQLRRAGVSLSRAVQARKSWGTERAAAGACPERAASARSRSVKQQAERRHRSHAAETAMEDTPRRRDTTNPTPRSLRPGSARAQAPGPARATPAPTLSAGAGSRPRELRGSRWVTGRPARNRSIPVNPCCPKKIQDWQVTPGGGAQPSRDLSGPPTSSGSPGGRGPVSSSSALAPKAVCGV